MDVGGAKIIILAIDASSVVVMAMMIMCVGMSMTMIVGMAAR